MSFRCSKLHIKILTIFSKRLFQGDIQVLIIFLFKNVMHNFNLFLFYFFKYLISDYLRVKTQ